MNDINPHVTVSADEHARAMADYIAEGTRRAYEIGNRGPIRRDANGMLDQSILDAYSEHGFYVFEGVVSDEEQKSSRSDANTCSPVRLSIRRAMLTPKVAPTHKNLRDRPTDMPDRSVIPWAARIRTKAGTLQRCTKRFRRRMRRSGRCRTCTAIFN